MDSGLSTARQARTQYRHELRTLTYVTIDQANGGIVRNLTHEGIGVQAVAAVRPRQQVRVRFELRYPRLRVEARGEVAWSTFSGQCGIRLLDMPPRLTRQIDEWIFGNLLEGASFSGQNSSAMFERLGVDRRDEERRVEEDDGLLLSPAARKIIELPARPEAGMTAVAAAGDDSDSLLREMPSELDWLSQPLSGRGLAWTVNSLVVIAALLLFATIFLSVTREAPAHPWQLAFGSVAAVGGLYWGFFKCVGGASPGARLAKLAEPDREEEELARFR